MGTVLVGGCVSLGAPASCLAVALCVTSVLLTSCAPFCMHHRPLQFAMAACIVAVSVLKLAHRTPTPFVPSAYEEAAGVENLVERLGRGRTKKANKSPYERVQTLSFQVYTGGAPAFIVDESTGEEKRNPECEGCECNVIMSFATRGCDKR